MADRRAVPPARGASSPAPGPPARTSGSLGQPQALVDLLDRLVDSGAVVSGEVVVALAGVDLLKVDLRLLLVGVQTAIEGGRRGGARSQPGDVRRTPS